MGSEKSCPEKTKLFSSIYTHPHLGICLLGSSKRRGKQSILQPHRKAEPCLLMWAYISNFAHCLTYRFNFCIQLLHNWNVKPRISKSNLSLTLSQIEYVYILSPPPKTKIVCINKIFSLQVALVINANVSCHVFVSYMKVTFQIKQCLLQELCHGCRASFVTWTTHVSKAPPVENLQVSSPTIIIPCK